jgi:hypothetical protein
MFVGLLFSGSPALADARQFDSGTRRVSLLELFTSQGCNSCPPAERWLGDLRDDPRLWRELVPVAFHVDYWDGLGWRDQFARAEFSQRQRNYHREGLVRGVYTPGFVFDGHEWRGWFGRGALPAVESPRGRLQVSLDDNEIRAEFDGNADSSRLKLHIAVLGVGIESAIGAGENRGRKLSQDFSVLGYRESLASDDRWRVGLPVYAAPDGARLALAAWVSRADSQLPLQATGGWLTD